MKMLTNITGDGARIDVPVNTARVPHAKLRHWRWLTYSGL